MYLAEFGRLQFFPQSSSQICADIPVFVSLCPLGIDAELQSNACFLPLSTRQALRPLLRHGRQGFAVWTARWCLQAMADVEGKGRTACYTLVCIKIMHTRYTSGVFSVIITLENTWLEFHIYNMKERTLLFSGGFILLRTELQSSTHDFETWTLWLCIAFALCNCRSLTA